MPFLSQILEEFTLCLFNFVNCLEIVFNHALNDNAGETRENEDDQEGVEELGVIDFFIMSAY